MKRNQQLPEYGRYPINGHDYYRTRVRDADGKLKVLYAETREDLFEKEMEFRENVEDTLFRKRNPTVAEYCEKWLEMQSGRLSPCTIRGYRSTIMNYIVKPLGDMYLSDVRSDDIQVALVAVSKKSSSVYSKVNMLYKCIFFSAERSNLLDYNPSAKISGRGGKAPKEREILTNEQIQILLDTIKDLPPYVFTMLGLYAGLRREEILALQWDCIFLDAPAPYISVKRAWRSVKNRPEISTKLKTPAAKRDIPIPKKLVECLREQKEKSTSAYVVADRNGKPLSESQFERVWKYIRVRSTRKRSYYKYVNGEGIRFTVKQELGSSHKCHPGLICTMDFDVTPHQLRHTYITNLIHAGVDPKTVQYLAGHENSKTTMDIYAKVKYNRPNELLSVVNRALQPSAPM